MDEENNKQSGNTSAEPVQKHSFKPQQSEWSDWQSKSHKSGITAMPIRARQNPYLNYTYNDLVNVDLSKVLKVKSRSGSSNVSNKSKNQSPTRPAGNQAEQPGAGPSPSFSSQQQLESKHNIPFRLTHLID